MSWLKLLSLFLALIRVEAGVVTIPLTNDHDVIYRGKVHVGEPAQTFDAVFHTGCTLTRFPARGCTASGRFPDACEDKNTYDPGASKTAQKQINAEFEIGDTKSTVFKAKGQKWYETLSLGSSNAKNNSTVKRATVGAAEKVWGFDHAVVCMGMSRWQDGMHSTFYDLFYAGLLTEPTMTVALRKCDREFCQNGGLVTLGERDWVNCGSFTGFVHIDSDASMWNFTIEAVSVNGQNLFPTRSVIIETGSSYIQVIASDMPLLVSLLKAQKHDDQYTMPCDSHFELAFMIKDHNYVLNEKHLLLHQKIDDQCVVAITESKHQPTMYVLGSAFFRSTCVIYEHGSYPTITFAAIINR